MAIDPRAAPPTYLTPEDYYRDAPAAMAKMPSNEQMHRMMKEAEERRAKEQHMKNGLYRQLLDAWSMPDRSGMIKTEAETLGTVIREKIEEHKRMVKTLEWFAAHVSLDDPEASTVVGRVILEGLNAIQRNRLG